MLRNLRSVCIGVSDAPIVGKKEAAHLLLAPGLWPGRRRIDGRDHYLGVFGSPESHEKYLRLIAESQTGQQTVRSAEPAGAVYQARGLLAWPSISSVLLRYKAFCEGYYARGGKPTKEMTAIRYSLRPLREHYASVTTDAFGPLALKALQQHLVGEDLCRTLINSRINRVKRFFKWAVSKELAPGGAWRDDGRRRDRQGNTLFNPV